MPKSRSMIPGGSGSGYNTNSNSWGNGNGKWQGLPPSTNVPSELSKYINSRAWGDRRNVVFLY